MNDEDRDAEIGRELKGEERIHRMEDDIQRAHDRIDELWDKLKRVKKFVEKNAAGIGNRWDEDWWSKSQDTKGVDEK